MSLISDSYISFVNLDHRKDRLSLITGELEKLGIEAVRTPGIYPKDLNIYQERYAKMSTRPPGAIGCYESQLNVMKEALRLNKHAMVFEDDVVFCSDFIKRLEYIENWMNDPVLASATTYSDGSKHELRLPRSIDVIWFGGTVHIGGTSGPYWWTRAIGRDAELTSDPRMLRSYGSFSTFAYFVHKNSLQKVINMLEDFMPQSIGIDYSFIKLATQMHNYVFVPGCCKQIDNESDQNPGSGEWTHFSKFEKLNGTIENSRYWFQDTMENFDPLSFNWAEARV